MMNRKKKQRRWALSCLHALWMVFVWMWQSPAFADTCDDLDRNEAWTTEFSTMNDAIHRKDWMGALEHSKRLETICEQSPNLNYAIARIHKNMDNQEKYLFYLQKATQNTERFAVDKDILDRMWSEKYIATHPDAAPEKILERDAAIQEAQEELALLKEQHASMQIVVGDTETLKNRVMEIHRTDEILFWTGIAIGGVGLVLTGVGAGLVAKYKDGSVDEKKDMVYTKSPYSAAWTVLGFGMTTTIFGGALSGYFGYRYKKSINDSETKEFSFTIHPTYTSIKWMF